jgi:hypothetical protein
MVFGGIHCVGWLFSFPSHMEQLLWKMSPIMITGVPLIITMFVLITDNFDSLPIVAFPLIILFFLSLILYVLARIALLVLPFMALRSLPSSALQTVRWTTFLPHV